MNNNTTFVLELLGIADKYTIKGKQLFIPSHKLGNLYGGCLDWYSGCQSLLCPALYGAGLTRAQDSLDLKVFQDLCEGADTAPLFYIL